MFQFPKNVLTEIKNFLEGRLRDTRKKMSKLSAQDPFHDVERLNDNASPDTEAYEQNNHERVQALKKEMEDQQNKIKIALEKIKKGKYGFCAKCGKMIDTERLSALPMAEFCLTCEENKNK